MSRPWSDCRSHGYRVKPGEWRGHSVRRVTRGDKYSMDPDAQPSVRTWGCLRLGRDPKENNKRADGDHDLAWVTTVNSEKIAENVSWPSQLPHYPWAEWAGACARPEHERLSRRSVSFHFGHASHECT